MAPTPKLDDVRRVRLLRVPLVQTTFWVKVDTAPAVESTRGERFAARKVVIERRGALVRAVVTGHTPYGSRSTNFNLAGYDDRYPPAPAWLQELADEYAVTRGE